MVSLKKVYVVTNKEWDDEGENSETEVVYVTMSKDEASEINRLWEKAWTHRFDSLGEAALKELHERFGIITWSGAEVQVREKELHGYKRKAHK